MSGNSQDDDLRRLRQDAERKQQAAWRPEPVKMAEVLSTLLARRGYLQTLASDQLQNAWAAAVGAEVAQQTRPGKLRGGVLEVYTLDAPLIQELTFRKRELIRKLCELIPDQKIRDLRLRVGDTK